MGFTALSSLTVGFAFTLGFALALALGFAFALGFLFAFWVAVRFPALVPFESHCSPPPRSFISYCHCRQKLKEVFTYFMPLCWMKPVVVE